MNNTCNQDQTIRPGLYQHYKGNFYQVISTVRHSETEEVLVLYFPLQKDSQQVPKSYPKLQDPALMQSQNLWVRPLQMFTESVLINGVQCPRFKWVNLG
ncbi:DUF1653 domain-containing protein [Aliikangiella sp. IMCC44632]